MAHFKEANYDIGLYRRMQRWLTVMLACFEGHVFMKTMSTFQSNVCTYFPHAFLPNGTWLESFWQFQTILGTLPPPPVCTCTHHMLLYIWKQNAAQSRIVFLVVQKNLDLTWLFRIRVAFAQLEKKDKNLDGCWMECFNMFLCPKRLKYLLDSALCVVWLNSNTIRQNISLINIVSRWKMT